MFYIISRIIFYKYIHINTTKKNIIETDNILENNLKVYENDSSFTEYQTQLKPIAFYYPDYNNISYLKYFYNKKKLNQFNSDIIEELIEKQIKLAKAHGIYGFAIYLDIFNSGYYQNIVNNYFSYKSNFPFFLIWKNDDMKYNNTKFIENLINNLKKFIIY